MTTRQISYRLKADGKAELKRDATEVGAALEDAGERGAASFERTNRVLKATGELSDGQVAKYKRLAQAAAEAQRAEEAQARINGVLGVGGGARLRPSDFLGADELGGPAGLTRRQQNGRLNLARQGADIFTTAGMGMDPTMIAIQQGPQIIEAMAEAGIKLTPVMIAGGAAVAGLAASVGALATAGVQYEAQATRVSVALAGQGRILQMTTADFDRYAQAGAAAGDISIKAATDAGVAYASTGRIGGGVLGELIALTRRYALTTGQDIGAATGDLAKHFSTGSAGVVELNDKLHFLNAAELEHVRNLMDSGRETDAQRIAVERLGASMANAATVTAGWGDLLRGLGETASDVWTKVGRAIDLAMGGGTDQQQLQTLLEKRSQAVLEQRSSWIYLGKSAQDFDREIAQVRGRIAQSARSAARGAANDRDTARDAIVRRHQDPEIAKIQDLSNERAKYLSLGGREGDATVKALDADLRALRAGYSSATDMANKLKQAHDKALREGKTAARQQDAETRKAARQAEEAIRLEGLRADHALDNQRRLAAARGDESALDVLERQGRLQDEINRYLREGFSITQATANARGQVRDEMQAESDRLRKERSNPEGFVSSQDSIAAALKGSAIEPASWLNIYGDRLRLRTRDAFEDGLLAGMDGGSFFKVFADRLKYAAASALASSLTKDLFGSREGGGTVGLIQKALKFLPKFAAGTDFAPGGLSLVGEYGPEIVNLPRGSGVKSAQDTHALVQNAAVRAANAPAMPAVQITYAPRFDARGAGPREIEELRAQMAAERSTFEARVTQAVQDGLNRRKIRV